MKTRILIFSLIILFYCRLTGQENFNTISVTDTFRVNLNNSYELTSPSIVPFSEIISIGGRTLTEDEYKIDYLSSRFSINDSVKYSLFDSIIVKYDVVLTGLKKEYFRRSLVVLYDSILGDSLRVLKSESSALSTDAIFGKDIQRSGSLIRGFTVGTNKDFSVNSGLRLQLSGKLSDDIEIVAALSDENTPIQPEGNTEQLEELDKVFIEVRHPNITGTFGDYDLVQGIGEFGKINRKLQGLKSSFKYNDMNGTVAIASSRGKFNSSEFTGNDGNQGPYRLNGLNNEKDIIVIAGSERVFLDGQELKRGENNDYVIEYANAEITFTPNRLITSASRISVDFEYTDRQFQRNMFGANFGSKLLTNKINVGLSFFREADDENSPIDISISDEERKILELAGDNRELAVRDGAVLVLPDSTGKIIGVYQKIDTLLNNNQFAYYKYKPGGANSFYNVAFSYVGLGKGDYLKDGIGQFRFVGIANGSYMPIKSIPLAQTKQFGNIELFGELFKGLNYNIEFAGSFFDKNNFSKLDDENNYGFARNFKVDYNTSDVELGIGKLKKIGVSYRDRFIDNKFTSLDRFNSVEFSRDYNSSFAGKGNESLREAAVNISPVDKILFTSSYGMLNKGSSFSSDRYWTNLNISDWKGIVSDYKIDIVNSSNGSIKSSWEKQNGILNYNFKNFSPGIEFLLEDKQDRNVLTDSLMQGSYKYKEIAPLLNISKLYGFDLSTRYSFRDEWNVLNGSLMKESFTNTQSYSLLYRSIKEVNSEFSVVIRNKKYTESFSKLGNTNNETVLTRSKSRFNLWDQFINGDLFYEASTQKTAKLEKVFIRVQQGLGNYIYLGDINQNGIADEEEFEPTIYEGDYVLTTLPTDELFPVVDLKTSTRWNINFDKMFSGNSILDKILNPVSTETSFRMEENSKTKNTSDIYFLRLSKFLNDSNTVRGFNFLQQDINLFRNRNDLSFRFRFIERNSLNQFNSGLETGYFNERSIRIKFRMVEEINNQTDITSKKENVMAPSNLNRTRNTNEIDLTSDFSYHPMKNIEIGFVISTGKITDSHPDKPTEINNNSQLLRLTLSFAGKGRLRLEGERKELNALNSSNVIPYEITKGNVIGKNYLWRMNFDYKLTSNLQTNISYNGRKQGKGDVIHYMRAEVRAFF